MVEINIIMDENKIKNEIEKQIIEEIKGQGYRILKAKVLECMREIIREQLPKEIIIDIVKRSVKDMLNITTQNVIQDIAQSIQIEKILNEAEKHPKAKKGKIQ